MTGVWVGGMVNSTTGKEQHELNWQGTIETHQNQKQ